MSEPRKGPTLEQLLTGDLRGPLPKEDFSLLEQTPRIRSFDDIPDFWSTEVKPVEWIVDRIAAHKSMTLVTGVDGTAKTFLAQSMAIAVGNGGEFLGKRCKRTPVVYMDFENADFSVRDRLDLIAPEPVANVKFWGMWVDPQPVPIGSDVLLKIAKETQPLILIDPFRYSHLADENDSTAMMEIMKHLRTYATAGAGVVIYHHPAKAEGSTGRGSSAIRGACDIAWLQEMNDETGLITLRCGKNRFGERPTIHIQPNFEEATFQVVDSPAWVAEQEEVRKLREIIVAEPGLSGSQIHMKAGGRRTRIFRLLKEYSGREWRTEEGHHRSILYFSVVPISWEPLGTAGTTGGKVSSSVVPTPIVGTTGTTSPPPDSSSSQQYRVCRDVWVQVKHTGEHGDYFESPTGEQFCGRCFPMAGENMDA